LVLIVDKAYSPRREKMYVKPEVVKFGTLRELTQIGLGSDCDGGIAGITTGIAAATDGSWLKCRRS